MSDIVFLSWAGLGLSSLISVCTLIVTNFLLKGERDEVKRIRGELALARKREDDYREINASRLSEQQQRHDQAIADLQEKHAKAIAEFEHRLKLARTTPASLPPPRGIV